MGDRRIYLRSTDILDEAKAGMNELNDAALCAVSQSLAQIAAAIAFLQERYEYWGSEYRYWNARLYDSEGRINRYASDKLDLAKEKMALIRNRLNKTQMYSESLQKYSSDREMLNTKAQQGGAFLELKKDQANTIMAMRVSQGQFGYSNRTSESPVSAGSGVSGKGKLSPLEVFAHGVQAGIIALYRNDICDDNKKKDAAAVSAVPFWRISNWKAAGEYANDQIKVRFDASDKERIITHETFHRLSDNGGNNEFSHAGIAVYRSDIGEMLGYKSANVSLNEGITELYTRRYAETNGIASKNSYYTRNVDLAARLESIVGNQAMSRAYFRSEPSVISSIFALAFGEPRAFAYFSQLVDTACAKGHIDSPEAALAYIKAQKMLVVLRRNLLRRI